MLLEDQIQHFQRVVPLADSGPPVEDHRSGSGQLRVAQSGSNQLRLVANYPVTTNRVPRIGQLPADRRARFIGLSIPAVRAGSDEHRDLGGSVALVLPSGRRGAPVRMVRMIGSLVSHSVSSRPGLPTWIKVFHEELTILDAQLKGLLVPADPGRGDVHSRLQVKTDFVTGTDHRVLYQTPSRQQAPRVIAPVVESP